MKIGILTYHRSINYGAYLQSYALYKYLSNSFPHSTVEIIDYHSTRAQNEELFMLARDIKHGNINYSLRLHRMFHVLQKKLPLSKQTLVSDDLERFRKTYYGIYDVIIAGSDQIWRLNSFRGFPNAYWLPVDLGSIKLSYAASSRSNIASVDVKTQQAIKRFLSDFKYIGVRDDITKEELGKLGNMITYKNCDPVFLYDFRESSGNYLSVLNDRYNISHDKPIIGFMTRDEEAIKAVQNRFKDSAHYISIYIPHRSTTNSPALTPFEFVEIISNLDYFVTSYFHGLCFAIKGNVPVIALEKRPGEKPANSKMFDLLHTIGRTDRYLIANEDEYITSLIKDIETQLQNREESYDKGVTTLKLLSNSFISVMEELDRHYDN